MNVSDFVRDVLTKKSIVEHHGTQKLPYLSLSIGAHSRFVRLGMAYFSDDIDNQILDVVPEFAAQIQFSQSYRDEGEGVFHGGSSNNGRHHHKLHLNVNFETRSKNVLLESHAYHIHKITASLVSSGRLFRCHCHTSFPVS